MTAALLGLGTYRVRPSALPDAVRLAAGDPDTSWVDTAPNYLAGQAHSLLAPSLIEHPLRVSTKVGFLTAQTAKDAVADGALHRDVAETGHCLSPAFVHWQCARNRVELGRDSLDMVFAHNPERHRSPYRVLRDTFAALEEEVAASTLSAYGVATWDGFDTGTLSVPELDRIATEAAGSAQHHLHAIQLPVSLVTANAIGQALNGKGPLLEAASRGWQVYASAPLFGGELPELSTPEVADLLHPGLTIAQTCLLAAASCPGVSRVLLSASTPAHWDEARSAFQGPPVPPATLRKVLDVLTPS